MLDSSPSNSDVAGEEASRLRWPETGGIKLLLEVLLLYHLVLVALPVLRAQIELLYPTLVPEPFTTVLYALLWLGIGATIVWLWWSESLVSTHRFDEPGAAREYLDRELPVRRWLLMNGGLTIFGGGLGWITYERFVGTLLHMVDALVIVVGEFEWMVSMTDGFYVGGFLGGFLMFATGIDRLVVGGLRRYIQRHHVSS